jgi:hypothetical protein
MQDDIKAIRVDINEIKTTLAVNTESLKQHMERTRINEKRIERAEDWSLRIFGAVGLAVLVAAAKLLIG